MILVYRYVERTLVCRPFISCWMNNQSLNALIDTGSDIPVFFNRALFENLFSVRKFVANIKISGFGGEGGRRPLYNIGTLCIEDDIGSAMYIDDMHFILYDTDKFFADALLSPSVFKKCRYSFCFEADMIKIESGFNRFRMIYDPRLELVNLLAVC